MGNGFWRSGTRRTNTDRTASRALVNGFWRWGERNHFRRIQKLNTFDRRRVRNVFFPTEIMNICIMNGRGCQGMLMKDRQVGCLVPL